MTLALIALASCSSDSERAGNVAQSTTTVATKVDTIAPSSTEVDGPTPIPANPADLEKCATGDRTPFALTPSRRWATPPEGWEIRYAYTEYDASSTESSDVHSTSLIRLDGDRVVALALLGTGREDEAPDSWETNTTLRGRPASLRPSTNRGGPTGGVDATWSEDGYRMSVQSRGETQPAVRSLIDELQIAEGIATGAPSGWQIIAEGKGASVPKSTVIGMAEADSPELGPLGAPVEIIVEEGLDAKTVIPFTVPILDPGPENMTLLTHQGRPVLVTEQLDDSLLMVRTATPLGRGVTVGGSLPVAAQLEIAASITEVAADDERLMGIPIGGSSYSPGQWCRDDL